MTIKFYTIVRFVKYEKRNHRMTLRRLSRNTLYLFIYLFILKIFTENLYIRIYVYIDLVFSSFCIELRRQ